jgi:tetratricopeptide (TPR) repeat protein
MQVLELRNILESHEATDYASCLVRSLRTDDKIWNFLLQSTGESSKQITDLAANQKLNPGTMGLVAFNHGLLDSNYPDSRLQVSLLEECMVHYESFLQQHNPPLSLEEAAKLALVLIEKRKITPAWQTTLLEIVNRMHLVNANSFRSIWGTSLVIALNLVRDQDDLLADLLKLQTEAQGIEVLIYCVLSLPIVESEKAEKIANCLKEKTTELIEKTLLYLISINEKSLAQSVAKVLVGRYSVEDAAEKTSKEMMDNLEETLQKSMLYKQIASIAQLAGETDLAARLLAKSSLILDSISTGIKVQKLSIYEQTGNSSDYSDLVRNHQLDHSYDTLMAQELASVGVIPPNDKNNKLKNQPIAAIRQAKKIQEAGNPELAKLECEKSFTTEEDDPIKSVIDFQPRFNPNWNPGDLVNTLSDLGARSEAMNLASKLQLKNPASLSASAAAADNYYAVSRFAEALPLFEYISFSGDSSAETLRKLAECYSKTGNAEGSYKASKKLVEVENPEVDDMLQFADAAISAGRTQEVFQITSQIIEKDPTNTGALTINGKAYAMSGNRDMAKDYFKKAIDIGADDADPWIGLSELQIKGGEFKEAIETLRQGVSAMPANREIKRRLAEQLMDSGSASEALPLLNDLAEEQQDAFIGVLQASAMKTLGIPEYDSLVDSLYAQFPNNEDIAQAYAAQLIKNGQHAEAKQVLQGQMEQVHSSAPTALTYAEAVVGMDVHFSGEPKKIADQEMEKVQSIVDRYLEQDSDNSHAQLVKAEMLVSKGDYAQAFELYSRLLEKQTTIDKSLWERIQAGFAQSSAFMGKFEVALAAIKQAVDAQPEWAGLRKIMATIYGMAGEIADALEQATVVLDVAPQIVESALWFADFVIGLGKSDVAEKKLALIIENESDDMLLHLKLAETKIIYGKSEEASQLLEMIKPRLSIESTDVELIAAAKLYDQVSDSVSALTCLEYRCQAYPFLESIVDLAGYQYEQSQYDKSLKQLETLGDESTQNSFVQCLKADVLILQGELERAMSLVQESYPNEVDNEIVVTFVPDSWKKLMNSNRPELALQAKILLMQGKAATCFEVTKEWFANEPESNDARILAIESSLALGDTPGQELFEIYEESEFDDSSYDHLLALKINSLIEKDQTIEAQQLLEKAGKIDSLSLKLAGIMITIKTGDLAEAERIFEEVITVKEEINTKDFHIKIGINRLLVKTAAVLQRWNEALKISSEAVTNAEWNLECILQSLSILTRAKEFEDIAKTLLVDMHNPSAFLQQIKVEDEINWLVGLTGGKAEKEVEHWLLRGMMAASPVAENIRAFALITPTPDDAAAMISALYANGQITTALQVAKKFPTNAKVLFELARIQSDGEEGAALATLDTLISNEPLFPAALALRSSLYEKTGKLDMAINDLEQAISDWPNEIKWRMKAAALWQEYGNNKNGVLQLQAAYDINPTNTDVVLGLSKALVFEGENENAIEILVPLAKQNPNLYEAWEILAESQLNCGQLDQALESALKASQANPFSIKPYLMSGKIHLLNGHLDKALDQARMAVTQNKKDAEAILFLAKVLHLRGEKQQALAALEMTNKCDNVTVQTMVDHVNLVKEINGGAYAKELISSFSSKYPENVDLMKMLASAQEENGEKADAEQTVKRALQVEPDEPELHLILGKISADTGQLDQAIHHLSQGIAQKTKNTDGFLLLSNVYEQQREFTKALDTLNKAMEEFPHDKRYYLAAANLYRNSKNYSAAEKVLQRAVQIDPLDVTIRRQLGALLALKLVHHSQEASSQS